MLGNNLTHIHAYGYSMDLRERALGLARLSLRAKPRWRLSQLEVVCRCSILALVVQFFQIQYSHRDRISVPSPTSSSDIFSIISSASSRFLSLSSFEPMSTACISFSCDTSDMFFSAHIQQRRDLLIIQSSTKYYRRATELQQYSARLRRSPW